MDAAGGDRGGRARGRGGGLGRYRGTSLGPLDRPGRPKAGSRHRRAGQDLLHAGALHRYLAEAVWLPTALLPSQGVVWEPVDDTTARATLADAGVSVSLEFQFGPDGEIVRAFTPERYRDVKGTGVPTSWVCKYRSYSRVEDTEGAMVPMAGEVAWLLPEGELTYWRGQIVRAEYEMGR